MELTSFAIYSLQFIDIPKCATIGRVFHSLDAIAHCCERKWCEQLREGEVKSERVAEEVVSINSPGRRSGLRVVHDGSAGLGRWRCSGSCPVQARLRASPR